MNKRVYKKLALTIAIIVATVIISGVAVYAKQVQQSIKVIYNNIKVVVDGKVVQAKDSKGNAVEPFIYNGVPYLPISSVASSLGKTAKWDTKANTVTIGDTGVKYLDQMAYLSFESTGATNYFEPFKNIEYDKVNYTRGLRYKLFFNNKDEKTGAVGITTEYLLNKQYSKFLGTLIVESEKWADIMQPTIIKFYGDDNLIYTTPQIAGGMTPLDINIDLKGVNILKIETNNKFIDYGGANRMILFAEARLAK
ncbi:MAG: NPCBM/NEW2 domain-containing protein [Clostridia bacterium]|nr:NPCBM/NEW2 domain-containing protein [Clostridia bacterium]